MILILVILLIVLIILGLPLFIGILAAAMLGLNVSQVDLAAIPIEIFRLANSPVLLAIPLFQEASSDGFPGVSELLPWYPVPFLPPLQEQPGLPLSPLAGCSFPHLYLRSMMKTFPLA